jgi:hypothetical protein
LYFKFPDSTGFYVHLKKPGLQDELSARTFVCLKTEERAWTLKCKPGRVTGSGVKSVN